MLPARPSASTAWRDVTERVEQSRRLTRLQRIREVIGAVNAAIVRIRDRRQLFEEFCRIAVEQGEFVLARIIEFDRDGSARIAASTEPDPRCSRRWWTLTTRTRRTRTACLPWRARSASRSFPTTSPTTRGSRTAPPLTREGKLRAGAGCRWCSTSASPASWCCARAKAGFFDQEESRLLTEMVSNISFALELMDKQERIAYLALYDSLTACHRTLFHDRLTQGIKAARPANSKVALLLVDLERSSHHDTLGRASAIAC